MPAPASLCVRCGNRSVRPRVGAGRFRPYRMLPALALPADFPIPTCGRCQADYIDGTTAEALAQVMLAAFDKELRRRVREAVAEVCKYISQRRLEKLLGLSQGYLSRLKAGAGNPSPQLVVFLALLARQPELIGAIQRFWAEPSEGATMRPAHPSGSPVVTWREPRQLSVSSAVSYLPD